MNIALLFLTHNRLSYTQMSIERLLEDKNEQFDLHIWDNASNDGTAEYLKSLKDPRIREVVTSKENVGQTPALNHVWGTTKAELVGKVDNDCLMTPGWTGTLAQAHKDIGMLGAIGCWHFFPQDFDYEVAKHKIQQFGNHKIFRHPWIGGTGFLLKRKTYLEMGPWKAGINSGTTYYYMKMALAGYINGWYYPLIHQEHMDDPVSKYSKLRDDEAIKKLYETTYTLRNRKIKTMDQRMQWRHQVITELLSEPWDVRYYTGWRLKVRRLKKRILNAASILS